MKFFAEEILNGKLHFLCSEHLFSHFLMAVHEEFLNNVSITFIDKTDPSYPLQRKDYWRQTLKNGLVRT